MDNVTRGPAAKRGAKQEPAWQRVYTHVRARIIGGEIAPGSFLEEATVSTEVGVSRTPVREAFQRLHAEQFIDRLPRRGAMVRAATAEELVQLYETRRVIESFVVRRIADEGIAVPVALDTLLVRLSAPRKATDLAFQAEGDFSFHRTLVDLIGNAVMLGVFDGLQLRQLRVATRAVALHPERLVLIHAQHAALLAALRRRDGAAAVVILDEHLQPAPEVLSRMQS
ncbi:GntR family transcriptional regulator [Rhodopila sp.]|uniref:GntR family transcriptional regulator n=1 Tax=Rhodopila sp. TaxID=2480087 RepID=UPI003D138E45